MQNAQKIPKFQCPTNYKKGITPSDMQSFWWRFCFLLMPKMSLKRAGRKVGVFPCGGGNPRDLKGERPVSRSSIYKEEIKKSKHQTNSKPKRTGAYPGTWAAEAEGRSSLHCCRPGYTSLESGVEADCTAAPFEAGRLAASPASRQVGAEEAWQLAS